MNLRHLLLLGQLPLWATLALAFIVLSGSLNDRVKATSQVIKIRTESAQLTQVLQAVVEMETGVRGYVVAGREEFLEPYHRGRTELPGRLARLRTLAASLPESDLALRDLNRIDSLAQRWIIEIAEPEIAAIRAGRGAEARALVSTGRGKSLIDALRQRVASYEAREQQRLVAQEAQARAQLRRLRLNLVLMGVTLLVTSGLAAGVLGGLLSSGFRHLGRGLKALRTGGQQVKVQVGGITELSRLGQDFNHMSEQLTQAQSQSQQRADELSRRNVQMRALGELSDWLQAARSLEEAAQILSRALPTLLPHTSGLLLMYNASRNLLLPLTHWGEQAEPRPATPEHCWALRRGEARFPGEGRFAPPCLEGTLGEAARPNDYVCFPLFSHGETLGLLRVYPQQGAPASVLEDREELRQLFVPLTRQIGLALSALQLQDRLLQQSLRDPLTGLANRRHLEQQLSSQTAHASSTGEALSLIALDIDHFKRLNDTFGHDAGDAVLVRLGATLRDLTPAGGLAARPGGEEFTVLLPGHDLVAALALAERVRLEVESWTLTHSGIALGQITVSQGVALYVPEQTPEAFVKRADEALYASKTAGRNRVTRAEG